MDKTTIVTMLPVWEKLLIAGGAVFCACLISGFIYLLINLFTKHLKHKKNHEIKENQDLSKLSKHNLRKLAEELSGMTKQELKDEDRWGLIQIIGTEEVPNETREA